MCDSARKRLESKKCQVVLQDLQVKNCYRNDSSKNNLEQEIVLCIGHHAYVMSLMWDFHHYRSGGLSLHKATICPRTIIGNKNMS